MTDLLLKFQMRFRYLQLRHGARVQFSQPPLIQADPIEEQLSPETQTSLYLLYILHFWVRSLLKWTEDWDDRLEQGPRLVISSRDKLIQVKFLHRIYYTPQKLHCIFPDSDPLCPKCKTQVGTFLHMFWDFPIIVRSWAETFSEINLRLQLSLSATPEQALLGVHDRQHPYHLKLLVSHLLFQAKRRFSLNASPSPPGRP